MFDKPVKDPWKCPKCNAELQTVNTEIFCECGYNYGENIGRLFINDCSHCIHKRVCIALQISYHYDFLDYLLQSPTRLAEICERYEGEVK